MHENSPPSIPGIEHQAVYYKNDEYSAHPFNAGMWRVDDETIVLGFRRIKCDYTNNAQLSHPRLDTYGEICTIRSSDGGETWEDTSLVGRISELSEEILYGTPPEVEAVDPTKPSVLLASWTAPSLLWGKGQPWVMRSTDNGQQFGQPTRVPKFHFERVHGRPNYAVRNDGATILTLSAYEKGNEHPRPVTYASFDGCQNWTFISYISDKTDLPRILPMPVSVEGNRLLTTVRVNPTGGSFWTEIYESLDGGRSWSFLSRPNDHGAPADVIELSDGRLFCVYGYRRPPQGVRCRFSTDGGETWEKEWTIRDDSATRDVGYPRAVENENGEIIVGYYINVQEKDIPVDGGVRHIAVSRFAPP